MTASASAALAEPTPMGIPLVDRKLVKAWFTGTLFWVVVGPVLGHASWHAYRAAVAD